jgi:hypothetical protein
MKYQFQLEGKRSTIFTNKGKKAVRIFKDSGDFLVNADLKAADGTMFDAVLVIDIFSSGEHCGTYILLPDKIVKQGEPGFLEQIGKTSEEFFPYKYKYRAVLPCQDHHVGDDGWSR